MANKRVEKAVMQILNEHNVDSLPIPINEIAYKRGLAVKPYNLGENVSGVLVINDGTGFIGYNATESEVRRRFTVAHELGHFELHKNNANNLFVDKQFKVEFRNEESSTGEKIYEREANAFAASILMPEKILIDEIKNRHFDLIDDNNIQDLAEMFKVSVPAMTFRLINLKLLSQI